MISHGIFYFQIVISIEFYNLNSSQFMFASLLKVTGGHLRESLFCEQGESLFYERGESLFC